MRFSWPRASTSASMPSVSRWRRTAAASPSRRTATRGDERVRGSHLLIAVGRRPNTDDLGLDAAGVKTDAKGYIVVDDQCRTNVDGIWAMGDVNGRGAFTHTSWNDYEVVAANMLDNDPRRISDRIPCYGLFIDPPLGRVGMTEREVREKGIKALAGKLAMTSVGRARERGETLGFMCCSRVENPQVISRAFIEYSVECLKDIIAEKMR